MSLESRMGRKSFCFHFRGIVRALRSLGQVALSVFQTIKRYIMIHQDIDKAKRTLATLQEEKRARQERIQLAIDSKRKFDADLHAHCQIPSAKERSSLS